MSVNCESWNFTPIGYVECPQQYRFESPRQSVYADNTGLIRLQPNLNLETAVRDLAGFERLWVMYVFHLNPPHWKPTVRPPVGADGRKIGVLSTRSPHRPNPIGLSCVELDGVDGLLLKIRNFDLLNGTPILDIKPYIPAADAFPDARTGWLPPPPPNYEIDFAPALVEQAEWIKQQSGLDLLAFCRTQLSLDPLNAKRKRLTADPATGGWQIGCRTWKIAFTPNEPAHRITATGIKSAYRGTELEPGAEDRYADKAIHRAFAIRFPG